MQNIVDLCTEHNVLDYLYDSQVHRIFQQKLDEDAEDRLMDLFESHMGESNHMPKKEVYPCLMKLCDEVITKMNTRVNMKANPNTAGRGDSQPKGGSGGGSGSGSSGGWKVKN